MKRRIETGKVARPGQSQSGCNDPFKIRRQMQRRQGDQPAQTRFKLRGHRFRTIAIGTAMDDPMTDIKNIADIDERFEPRHRPVERRRMINAWRRLINDRIARLIDDAQGAVIGADPDDSAMEQPARLGDERKNSKFKARRSTIERQDHFIIHRQNRRAVSHRCGIRRSNMILGRRHRHRRHSPHVLSERVCAAGRNGCSMVGAAQL